MECNLPDRSMSETNFNFWQKWLTYANLMTIIVGLLVAFAGNSPVFDLHNHYSNTIFFHGEKPSSEIIQYKNWLWGVIGGTIVGFHVLMIFISEYAFKRKERWAYIALWTGLFSWFIIDSAVSVFYGAIHNLLLINFVALIFIGIPLVVTRKFFL